MRKRIVFMKAFQNDIERQYISSEAANNELQLEILSFGGLSWFFLVMWCICCLIITVEI